MSRPKGWERRKGSSPKKNTRNVYKDILVVCEGQTEVNYFKAFNLRLRFDVEFRDMKGQNPYQLVDEALDIKNKNSYGEVWCVFDMDMNKGGKEYSDFDAAIQKAKNNNLKVAYSNDAFELWFYLHFNYTDQENHRTFYYEKLSKTWDINYVRNGKKDDFSKTIYDKLGKGINSLQPKAIERAKKLYKAKSGLPFYKQNPVTTVYKLVELLNDNLRP